MSKSMCLQPPRGTVRELRPVSGEREARGNSQHSQLFAACSHSHAHHRLEAAATRAKARAAAIKRTTTKRKRSKQAVRKRRGNKRRVIEESDDSSESEDESSDGSSSWTVPTSIRATATAATRQRRGGRLRKRKDGKTHVRAEGETTGGEGRTGWGKPGVARQWGWGGQAPRRGGEAGVGDVRPLVASARAIRSLHSQCEAAGLIN